MLNRTAITELADYIEAHPETPFKYWCSDIAQPPTENNICGTPGCIAGFAAALWPEGADGCFGWDKNILADKMGLDKRLMMELFFGQNTIPTMEAYEPTRDEAVKALRFLVQADPQDIETFDWTNFINPTKE